MTPLTRDICIDPRMVPDTQDQVCVAPAANGHIALVAENRAQFSLGAPALQARPGPSAPLFRDSAEFRRSLLQGAFTHSGWQTQAEWGSPLAYSLFALMPAACSEHPALNGGEGGSGSDGSSTSTDSGPQPLRLAGYDNFGATPCGNDGFVTDLDEGLGVCANYTTNNHHLFSWDATRPNSVASIIPLSYAPDQVLQGSNGEIYITTHQSPGLAVVNPTESSEAHYAFPTSIATNGVSSSGRPITAIQPSFPKGLAEAQGQVFIATSNYDVVHSDFLPGTVLAFEIGTGNYGVLSTSGFNPTSVGTADGKLLVVSSGAIDRNGAVTSDGFLDVFDPLSHDLLRSIPLGRHGAGVSGELTITPDGRTALLPTADNSGLLLAVNLQNGLVREIAMSNSGVSGSRIFFPSLQMSADGASAVVANFNDGRVYPLDLEAGVSETPLTLDSNTADGAGLSDGLRIGANYFIGMGPNLLRIHPVGL